MAATGETPARFVETARLDAARLLLARGVSLKAVAAHVGLFPATRLSQAFEQRFPGFAADVHGLRHKETAEGRRDSVDCVIP